MQKIIGILLALCSFFSFGENALSVNPPAERIPILRALLISCDHFVTQEDTWPAAEKNAHLLRQALKNDRRGYEEINLAAGNVTDAETLEEEVKSTFSQARPGDVSLLYFSTHGLLRKEEEGNAAYLVLSDGETENLIGGKELKQITDQIPGTKMIIFDACNSGAMIGKGLMNAWAQTYFIGPEYKILCSAGGSEASWYWQSQSGGRLEGASYFNAVLTAGLFASPFCPADANRDGNVTLAEIYDYCIENCAVSTPCVYPQNEDDFVLYAYEPGVNKEPSPTVTDLVFESTLLTAGESEARFSFTVQRETELYYLIVYQRDGVWQFNQAQQYQDRERPDGLVTPGRKERTLAIKTPEESESGYAMILLITREDGRTHYQTSRLLCVQPAEGNVKLSVITATSFAPAAGREMSILVPHDVPCALTVEIVSIEGDLIRRLAYEVPSRPQQLTPAGSLFYWDGKNEIGETAPYGWYRAVVRVAVANQIYTAESRPFRLIRMSPDAVQQDNDEIN